MVEIYAPPDTPPRILHADHQILVAEKPAGLLSVPGKGENLADCMMSRLMRLYPDLRLVHRLDRDTSGVMVFALTHPAQKHLGLQFENRQMRKVYVALVAGRVEADTGTVDLPLTVDWPNRPKQKIDHVDGRPAVTTWKVARREAGHTRMRLMPLTGRSHQLRVHMAAIGHAILGDPFYAEGAVRDHPRLMLHAETLRLKHPDGGKGMSFTAPSPF